MTAPLISLLDRLRWVDAVMASGVPLTACRLAGHFAYIAASGSAWRSRAAIINHLGVAERNLSAAFATLEQANFLKRGDLRGPVGRQTYAWILIIPPPAASSSGGESVSPPDDDASPAPDEDAPPPPASSSCHPLHPCLPRSKGGKKGEIMEGGREKNATPTPQESDQVEKQKCTEPTSHESDQDEKPKRTTPASPASDHERRQKNRERLREHLRGIAGLASTADAAGEWGGLMQNAGNCRTLDEVFDGIAWIVRKAHADGVTITYSKHAPPHLVKRWAAVVEQARKSVDDDADDQHEDPADGEGSAP